MDFKNSSVVNATVGCRFIDLFLQLISIEYQKKKRVGFKNTFVVNATAGLLVCNDNFAINFHETSEKSVTNFKNSSRFFSYCPLRISKTHPNQNKHK